MKFYAIRQVNKCEIKFTLLFSDKRRRDLDNYAATIKMILDGLVAAEILPDDNYKHVQRIIIEHRQVDGNEGIQVEITEV